MTKRDNRVCAACEVGLMCLTGNLSRTTAVAPAGPGEVFVTWGQPRLGKNLEVVVSLKCARLRELPREGPFDEAVDWLRTSRARKWIGKAYVFD